MEGDKPKSGLSIPTSTLHITKRALERYLFLIDLQRSTTAVNRRRRLAGMERRLASQAEQTARTSGGCQNH